MIRVSLMLFDLDGTLIDSKTDLSNSINLMLSDLSRPPLDEATVGGFVGDGVRVLVRRCLQSRCLGTWFHSLKNTTAYPSNAGVRGGHALIRPLTSKRRAGLPGIPVSCDIQPGGTPNQSE